MISTIQLGSLCLQWLNQKSQRSVTVMSFFHDFILHYWWFSQTDNLARIRNNQRRCRERRREYIAELELKLKYHEEEMLQCSTQLQTTTQNLLCENELLKRLLESSGICQNSQDPDHTIDNTQPKTSQVEVSKYSWLLLSSVFKNRAQSF